MISFAIKNKMSMLSDKLKTQMYSDKYKYFNVTLSQLIKTSPEKFWRHIKPPSPIINTFISDSLVMNDNTAIANSFNDHFKSVFTDDNGSMPSCIKHELLPSISDLVLSESGILNMLLNLNENKSMGPDCLPNAFLGGTLSGYLSIYLSFIKNLCLMALSPRPGKRPKLDHYIKLGTSNSSPTIDQFRLLVRPVSYSNILFITIFLNFLKRSPF
ncbi:unnamed protein product [Ixodes hexagonus]